MHPVDFHRQTVALANAETLARFAMHGPYTPGTPEHAFWLSVYDRELAKQNGAITSKHARLAKLLPELSNARAYATFLVRNPQTINNRKSRARTCKKIARLENKIADLEYELEKTK